MQQKYSHKPPCQNYVTFEQTKAGKKTNLWSKNIRLQNLHHPSTNYGCDHQGQMESA